MSRRTRLVMTAAGVLMTLGSGARAEFYGGGSGDGYGTETMTNDVLLGGPYVAVSSAANQSFLRGYAPVAIATITITDANPAVISNGTSLAVCIPAGFNMTWDETDTTATFGGTASGKVGAIGYAGSNKRLLVAVTNGFAANDTLTISDLSFKNYVAAGTTRLLLDFDNNGQADAQDDKTITVLGACYTGGSADSYARDAMNEDKGLTTAQVHGTVFRFW